MTQRVKKANFVPDQFQLGVFATQRNRLKDSKQLYQQLGKQKKVYSRSCCKENHKINATQKRLKHLLGYDTLAKFRCARRALNVNRDLVKSVAWQQAPNRYHTTDEPYFNQKGLLGAFWGKAPLHPRRKNVVQPPFAYNLPRDMDRFKERCHREKGILLSNPREKKATSRFMVNDPSLCYRHPEDPAPNAYYPRNHEIWYNVTEPFGTFAPNPHRFYRRSQVPYRECSYLVKHIGFAPGPGRFENRYREVCHCRPKLIFKPGIELEIAKQKRLKFRRLKYEKIKRNSYCTPEWRHIKGHGFRHLFRRPHGKKKKRSKQGKHKRPLPQGKKLYADFKYLNMINNPRRKVQYLLDKSIKFKPPRIEFNTLPKLIIKKQRPNKNLAFGSGQERWAGDRRTLPLTRHQVEAIKKTLPKDRQLHNKPVMKKSKKEITSKLTEIPQHMKLTYQPVLRKPQYKFSSLPGTKLLVHINDVRAPEALCKHKDLDPKEFFKPWEDIDPRYRKQSESLLHPKDYLSQSEGSRRSSPKQ